MNDPELLFEWPWTIF